MPWFVADNSSLDQLVSFLISHEWSCVGFSSQLVAGRRARLPSRRAATVHCYTSGGPTGQIGAAVLETCQGFCYPVLGGLPHSERLEAVDAFKHRLKPALNRYVTFMGLECDVAAFEKLVATPPRHRVEYYMMQATGPPATGRPAQLTQEPFVRRAATSDIKRLLPLQLEYEREEVLLPNRSLNTEATRRQLRDDLKSQVIYLVELNGVPIAKAGTNARGFRYDQIGGVFTDRQYRNRGVGAHLMNVLMRRLRDEGKAVCLFVKSHNHAAQKMYRNLGFNRGEPFVICYYH